MERTEGARVRNENAERTAPVALDSAEVRLFAERERRRAVDLFRVLGHEVRLSVLLHLSRSPGLTVSELVQHLGIEQSSLSHQLRILRDARLVRTNRSGRNVRYELFDRHVSRVIFEALEHVGEDVVPDEV